MSKVYVDIWDQTLPNPLPTEFFEPAASHGAELVFWGRVRNQNQGRVVSALSYDAFIPLAKQTLREVVAEAHWI